MTAVATERPGRTKLEQAERALADLIEERDGLVEDIARLTELEERAIRDSARSAPTARIFKLGSPAQRARERLEKAQKRLPLLEREIAAKHEAVGEMRARWAQEEIAKFIRRAEEFRETERAKYLRVAEAFAEVHARWLDAIAVVEELDRLFDETAGVRDHLAPEQREALARQFVPAIRPVPSSFPAFVSALLEATLDVSGRGLGEHGLQPLEVKALAELDGFPNLREQDRKLSASGRVPRSGSGPAWGNA